MRAGAAASIVIGALMTVCAPCTASWAQSPGEVPSGVPSIEELEKRLEQMQGHKVGTQQRSAKSDAAAIDSLSGPMARIGAGELHMGDSIGEGEPDEKPTHVVRIKAFQIGRFEVTRAQFRRFANQTGYRTDAEHDLNASGCRTLDPGTGRWSYRTGVSWRSPGFEQTDEHPVVCVSWNDAQAYIHWLNSETGKHFRLASEAEWEYAARAGSAARYPWGMESNVACRFANGADQTNWPGLKMKWKAPLPCRDGFFNTAPVGSYQPNDWGLSDLIGNVSEWTAITPTTGTLRPDPPLGRLGHASAARHAGAPGATRRSSFAWRSAGSANHSIARIFSAFESRRTGEPRESVPPEEKIDRDQRNDEGDAHGDDDRRPIPSGTAACRDAGAHRLRNVKHALHRSKLQAIAGAEPGHRHALAVDIRAVRRDPIGQDPTLTIGRQFRVLGRDAVVIELNRLILAAADRPRRLS
jgi:formylglycine-generating enzyme required for sulfatase activity